MKGRHSTGCDRKVSARWMLILCISSFCIGMLYMDRFWAAPDSNNLIISRRREEHELQIISGDCETKRVLEWHGSNFPEEES